MQNEGKIDKKGAFLSRSSFFHAYSTPSKEKMKRKKGVFDSREAL